MTFAAPHWLYGLILVPLFYFIFRHDSAQRLARMRLFGSPEVLKVIAPEIDPRALFRKGRIWIIGMLFLVLALARPQWGVIEERVKTTAADILFVLDVSNSMDVEDVVPSRFKMATHLIRQITDRLKGDRVGLVGFAGTAFLASPLTTDTDYLLELLTTLSPKLMGAQGTNVGEALDTSVRALERGAEEMGKTGQPVEFSSKVIVLVSDGEDLEGRIDLGIEQVKRIGAKFIAFGVGTEEGGPIPIRDDQGNLTGYKKDYKGEQVKSSFRPDGLKKLTDEIGGKYQALSGGPSDVEWFLQEIRGLNRTDKADRKIVTKKERYQIPLLLAVLFFIVELAIPARKIITAGNVAGLLIIFIGAGSTNAHAQARDYDQYTENKKGVEAFESGLIDEAKKRFGSAQAKDPDKAELLYNQGLIHLRGEDYDRSIQAFGEASEKAIQGKKPRIAAKSLYNQATAYLKKGQPDSAIRSLMKGLGKAEEAADSELKETIQKRILSLIQEQEEKQKQDQNKDDKKDQEQKDQQQQNSGQGGSGDNQDKKQDQGDKKEDDKNKEKKGEKEQDKEIEDPEKSRERYEQQTQSGMSRQDAENVLRALQSREKNLKMKQMKKDFKPQPGGKDW